MRVHKILPFKDYRGNNYYKGTHRNKESTESYIKISNLGAFLAQYRGFYVYTYRDVLLDDEWPLNWL